MPALGPLRRPIDSDTPAHLRWDGVLVVFLGGALGTAGRYGLARLWPTDPGRWPLGTFVANVVGAFVLGVLLEALARSGADTGWRQRLRLLGGTGFCGGFTTYSTFAVETYLLSDGRHAGLAFGYLAATVVAGLVAVVLGTALAAKAARR